MTGARDSTSTFSKKDLRIVLDSADELGIPLPGTSLVFQLYHALQAQDLGSEGNHALVETLEELAGIGLGLRGRTSDYQGSAQEVSFDPGDVTGGFHVPVRLFDLAVEANDERRPDQAFHRLPVHLLLTPCSERGGQLLVLIGEQIEVVLPSP